MATRSHQQRSLAQDGPEQTLPPHLLLAAGSAGTRVIGKSGQPVTAAASGPGGAPRRRAAGRPATPGGALPPLAPRGG
jgi:methylglyoxal synthase